MYVELCPLADTGISIESPRTYQVKLSDLDNRYFYYDSDSKTLWSVCPAVRQAVNRAISVLSNSYALPVLGLLDFNMIPNWHLRAEIIESTMHSIIFNQSADFKAPKCWQ